MKDNRKADPTKFEDSAISKKRFKIAQDHMASAVKTKNKIDRMYGKGA